MTLGESPSESVSCAHSSESGSRSVPASDARLSAPSRAWGAEAFEASTVEASTVSGSSAASMPISVTPGGASPSVLFHVFF